MGLALTAQAAATAAPKSNSAAKPTAPAQVAPAPAAAPAAAAPQPAAAKEAAKTATPATALSFTPDAGPAADISPAAHPEEYKAFKEKLVSQAKNNLYDFCPAMETVLKATNDVFAAQAWMEAAAKENLPAAMQYVADQKLLNVRRDATQSADAKEAYKLARKAADAGYEPAMVNVYMCLKNGVGVAKDEKGAEKYMMKACAKGGLIPRYKWLQISGKLQNFDSAKTPAVKSEVDRGNHHVIYVLAMMAPTPAERFELLQKAAKLGNPEALYTLSSVCSAKDPKLSYELLKQAIKMHSADAMFTLGTVLTEGDPESEVMKTTGLTHDDVNGRHLIEVAAMTGSAAADFWLGRVTHDGVYGVKQDDSRAYRYFEAGAKTGNASCAVSMAAMQLGGIGTKQEPRQALNTLNAVANEGSPQAIVMLAYALYTGTGVPADARKAEELLQDAAALDYPLAYVYLGYITTKGGDERMGRHWVDLAAHDVGPEATKLYDKLMADGWKPEP